MRAGWEQHGFRHILEICAGSRAPTEHQDQDDAALAAVSAKSGTESICANGAFRNPHTTSVSRGTATHPTTTRIVACSFSASTLPSSLRTQRSETLGGTDWSEAGFNGLTLA